jgi:excisionase family DNA binding protein
MSSSTRGIPPRPADPPADLAQPLLDVAEVARLTGTSERFARRLVQERRLPTVKVGRFVRVRADDLAAYLAEHTRPAVKNGHRA